MRQNSLARVFIVFVWCSLQSTIFAGYSLSPLITVLEPQSGKSNGVIEVKFIGNVRVPAAIELKVKLREIDINGKVVHKDDKTTENIIVYPTQIVLMPDDLQRVQVKWAGGVVPDRETTYGLIAEEAPVKLNEDQKYDKAVGKINLLTRYQAIVVVKPKNVKPNVVVESAEMKKDSTGSPRLLLTLHNSGTGMQTLSGMRLMVSPLNKAGQPIPGKNVGYKPVLKAEQKKHSLFAGYRRAFDLPWPAGVPAGPVRVAVDFEE